MPDAPPPDRRRRQRGAWLPIVIGALLVLGLGWAVLASRDDDGGVSDQAQELAGDARDTVTSEGSDAVDAVTDQGGDAVAAVTDEAGDVTGGGEGDTGTTGTVPAEVQSDPVVQRLARGRELPFTAGPWQRAAWRDAVWERLRDATQDVSRKVRFRAGYGIEIGSAG